MCNQNQATPTEAPLSPSTAAAVSSRRPRACACCIHRRTTCSFDCRTAPYFPATMQKEFDNVNRHFGYGYVIKLLRLLPPVLHQDFIAAVIYEADRRARDPVHGCCAVIKQLRADLESAEAELKIVSKNLDFQKARFLPRI